MARFRLPSYPSSCPQHDRVMHRPVNQRFYGLPYICPNGRPDSSAQRWPTSRCRRLNRDEGFLFFDPSAPESPYWGSRTTHAYNVLVKLVTSEYLIRGFCEVITPNMYSDSLWEPRGRWQHYSKEISRTETTRSEMLTVSCAGHCLFYGHTTPAADDLPVRHADFGVIHRSSGITSPLPHPYVCRLVEDDSHIFCRPNQIAEEIKSSIDFLSFFYEKVLKFELEVELYTRSHQRSIGNTSLWDMAEKVIRDEFWEKGGTFRLKEGAAPHYGPRFEIKARDRWGRYSLCGSIQIDFELPERFDLGYLSEDGQRLRPVLIHRAIVPPAETILAIIGNECNEYWPFWLSLHQVVVIPVCAASVAYARKVVKELVDANYEVEASFECLGTLNRRIKTAVVSRHNFILVVGKTESANGTVNVRTRNDVVLGEFPLSEVLSRFEKFAKEYSSDWQCTDAFLNLRESKVFTS